MYETIKRVDKNYLAYLLNIDEPSWNLKKYKNKEFISLLKKNQSLNKENYIYKESNLWCDILEFQAKKTKETGICKISAEQAFYMARLGYVVIASWKNLETDTKKNRSPHFVTISPYQENMTNFIDVSFLTVAHVGGGRNGFCKMSYAFDGEGNKKDNKYEEVLFYVNIYQQFC